jgi:hypothetical protein
VAKLSIILNLKWLHPKNWNLPLIWDLFMVWVAVINMALILFDLSYLWVRPYLRSWPGVSVVGMPLTDVYDQVKGIVPHPLTEALLAEADETAQLLELDPRSDELASRVERLRALSLEALEQDPFERSGQSDSREVITVVIMQELGRTSLVLDTAARRSEAVGEFWSFDPLELARRLEVFDDGIRPLLERNYYRKYDVRGRLVDHFFWVDLPFLLVFLVEFLVRWFLALKRRTYPRWFLFPIANWYDVLGLIPYARVFRLFRLGSIYMRLHRSELSRVGKDALSRGVAYISNIVAEEISDVVALRILSETEDEIREGTARRIWDETIESRRRLIEEVVICQLREILANEDTQERIRVLLRLNLENAVENTEALRAVPLPDVVLKPLVRGIGEVILETTLETVTATLASREGQEAARELVRSLMQQMLTGAARDVVDSMASQISLEILDQMKQTVAVKKWTLPDRSEKAEQLPG